MFIPGSLKFLSLVLSWFKTVTPRLKVLVRALQAEKKHSQLAKKGDESDVVDPIKYNSGFGYVDEEEDIRVAKYYFKRFNDTNFKIRPIEDYILYEHSISELSKIIQSGDVEKVVNFGVCWGYIDDLLAESFPEVDFIGIDRSPAVKKFNDGLFHKPNLSFLACDIMDYLDGETSLETTLFWHQRIGALLPQDFVEILYAELCRKKVKYIVGFEPHGISMALDDYFMMCPNNHKESVHFRSGMYSHNYMGILNDSGYRLSRCGYLKTAHKDSDYSILTYRAEK